ncbi:MAG TPA: putative metal-dependent hydrolase [Bacteroidia bacterium]|nr:putative metal-dependent hydrolase [Bacteroidia bacterium]HNT79192.1 putative metal-dependent hydrolase [Bacteroidia bacterium]
MDSKLDQLRFPIGKFNYDESSNASDLKSWIEIIKTLPSRLKSSVANLNTDQLNTPYRPEGWTITQVIHHLADSHINSYIRFKLALTENNPTIKPYEEADWAKLPDSNLLPIEVSLNLLEALHTRWTFMLDRMTDEDFSRTFFHPETKTSFELKKVCALYAWHCEHHLAHVTSLIQRKNW